MDVLDIFVHHGCLSEQPALRLAKEIENEFPAWKIQVVDNWEQAQSLGIITLPAFVLNGELLAVGVPRKEWLIRQLRARAQHGHE